MSVGAPSPHLGGDPNCFHELLWRCTVAQRRFGMPFDAARALRDVRDRDGDDLLGLRGQGPVVQSALVEMRLSSFNLMANTPATISGTRCP
jgi:hypothetical protein